MTVPFGAGRICPLRRRGQSKKRKEMVRYTLGCLYTTEVLRDNMFCNFFKMKFNPTGKALPEMLFQLT
jgi:hypothetical protein